MPGYKTHLIGGAVVAVPMICMLLSYAQSVTVVATWFVFALAGSLFPDVDTKSKGQKWFYRLVLVLLLALLFQNKFRLFVTLALFAAIPLVVNHRGLFHRLWFVVLLPLAVTIIFSWYLPHYSHDATIAMIFFIAGTISHLILDFGLGRTFRLRW